MISPEKSRQLYFDLLKQVLTGSLYDESAWHLLLPNEAKKGIYAAVRRAILRGLRGRSFYLVKRQPLDADRRAGGLDWPMIGYTMVGLRRLDNIQELIELVLANNVPGDFVECGVWRGGASIFARAVLDYYGAFDRNVWLADSFEGMPVPKGTDVNDPDLHGADYLEVSVDEVKRNFVRFGMLDHERVKFIKGWFCDTLHKAPIEKISVLRLDGDHYSSTMDSLSALYDRVSDGGFVIVDDYDAYPSCKTAITDFFSIREIKSPLNRIDQLAVYWQKPDQRATHGHH